jgi:hypothetical protein
MYFILVDSQIVDQGSRCPTPKELQEWANDCNGEVDVIDGQFVVTRVLPTIKKPTHKQLEAAALARDLEAQKEFAAFNGLEASDGG